MLQKYSSFIYDARKTIKNCIKDFGERDSLLCPFDETDNVLYPLDKTRLTSGRKPKIYEYENWTITVHGGISTNFVKIYYFDMNGNQDFRACSNKDLSEGMAIHLGNQAVRFFKSKGKINMQDLIEFANKNNFIIEKW